MAKTSIIAKVPVQPGKRDEVVAAFGSMFEAVNQEAGTEIYILGLDDNDENVVWVYELYSDTEAMTHHTGSDAMAGLIGAISGLLGDAPEMNFVSPVTAKGVEL